MPAIALVICPMIRGFSGLPKLRLLVMAIGVAPIAVIFRQVSNGLHGTGFRVSLDIAWGAVAVTAMPRLVP